LAPGYLFDTSAINAALDRGLDADAFAGRGALFITHVQADELRATRKPPGRLEALLNALEILAPEKVLTSVAVWNESKWGEARWGDSRSHSVYESLVRTLNTRNGSKANNARDALIGVTAIAEGMTLVTNDRDQGAVVRELGGRAVSFDAFLTGD
jgi:predicted nucleic acid-binding protein